jgi:catechol 2,3-dioxygenase-like lactoylglutathione lyase family enzyme
MLKLRHVGIIVSDIPTAIDFYVNLLGFKIVSRKVEKGNKLKKILGFDFTLVEWVKLKADNDTILELLKFKVNENSWIKPSFGLQHIALTVDDIDSLYKRICEEVNFNSKPIKKGNVKIAFCVDFDNNLIELVEEING